MKSTPPKEEEDTEPLKEVKRLHVKGAFSHYDEEGDMLSKDASVRLTMNAPGNQIFRHPEGSHDDQLWALALAAYSASKHQSDMFSTAMLVGASRQR